MRRRSTSTIKSAPPAATCCRASDASIPSAQTTKMTALKRPLRGEGWDKAVADKEGTGYRTEQGAKRGQRRAGATGRSNLRQKYAAPTTSRTAGVQAARKGGIRSVLEVGATKYRCLRRQSGQGHPRAVF